MSAFGAVLASLLFLGQLGPLTPQGALTDSLRGPARVAVAADATVLVTDPFNDQVAEFDATGTLIGTHSIAGGPIGIAVHPDGRYFISLRDEPKVAIYNSAFDRIGFLGEGDPLVTFVGPTDLDVATDTGWIYVADPEGDRVYGFESNGTLGLIIGVRGELPGELMYPSAITVDEDNSRLIVADHDNFRIQIFSTSGVFQQRFGYRLKYLVDGSQEGWTPRTQGLAVDDGGRIYVADALMGTVRIFDLAGVELGKVVEYGSDPGDLRTPCDLALSPDGSRLYVVSTNGARVEIYATPAWGGAAGLGAVGTDTTDPPGSNACAYDLLDEQGRALLGRSNDPSLGRQKAKARRSPRAGDSDDSGSGSVSTLGNYEGPHMIEASIVCGRCHGIDGQPGGHVGLVEGQAVLCFSCHSSGGQGLSIPLYEMDVADPYGTNPNVADGRGRSHAWSVAAVNSSADSVGPTPGGGMELYLDGGLIKCTTCHDQHTNNEDSPYLRINNRGDAMCKQCHAARDRGPGEGGSHPVGFVYPAETGEFPLVAALGPLPLKDDKVECMTCHGLHGADSGGANNGEGDGMLLRAANDETLCQTCHTEHIGHTPGGDWQPTCLECHGIHDPANSNLSLVGASVLNQTLAVDKAVVFSAREGANSFDDGDPAVNDGICQVCHTGTNYHTHDGSGNAHHDGETCTSCHPHDAGFMPTGGSCVDCHGVAQDNGDGLPPGGRRAVVGEFPVGDAHAHYGGELTSGACTVCHDQTTHRDGNVDLIDPDDGTLYTFVHADDLTSDPDLSTFCAHCHDPDGATRLGDAALDPFGSGNVPPDVASKFQGTLQWDEWYGDFCFGEEGTLRQVNSHHDISDADQAWSGAKIECLSCHGAHTSGRTQPMAEPYTTANPTAWTGSGNGFCLECHYGGFGPDDPDFPLGVVGPTVPLRGLDNCDYYWEPWWVQYNWTHAAHGLDSKRGWAGYSGAPEAEVDCTSCHDPHGSFTATNTLGNPYMIRDQVDGSAYVDDGVRPGAAWTGPPWDTFGTSREVVVNISGSSVDWGGATGLCNVCHSNWLGAYDWHSYCNGCQTCHGHGQAWQNNDWGSAPRDDTVCPHNNNCPHSARVAVDEVVVGTTVSADADDLPACGPTATSNGIWYSVIGTGGTMTVTTCLPGTSFDTSVEVFCDCETLGCIGGNDDDLSCGTSSVASTFSWCSDPDQVYEIYVGGSGGAVGDFELTITDDGIGCGTPQSCRPDPGACCSDVVCGLTGTHDECDASGGTDWYLEGDCSSFTCSGACCVGTSCDATGGEYVCDGLGGTWTAGEDCATYVCPASALLPATIEGGSPAPATVEEGPPLAPTPDGESMKPLHYGRPGR